MRRAARRHATWRCALLVLAVLSAGLGGPAEATEPTTAAAVAAPASSSSSGTGPATAQPTPLNRAERIPFFEALEKVWATVDAKQWASCLEALARIEPLARRDWTQTGMSWQGGRMHCELERRIEAGAVPGTALFDEITAPALAHAANAPAGAERRTGARLDLLRQRWRLMIRHGLAADAEREEADAC